MLILWSTIILPQGWWDFSRSTEITFFLANKTFPDSSNFNGKYVTFYSSISFCKLQQYFTKVQVQEKNAFT